MFEIIAQTLEDAIAAENGGATQLDLKADFLEGGTTPTTGMVECICESVNIDVIVMVRPRVDRMVYGPQDIKIMCRDIALARGAGAAGFLLGALTKDAEIDTDAILAFKEAAKDLPLHFHLAWELTKQPEEALEKMIDLGIRSARTTGGQGLSGKAVDGVDRIRKFNEIVGNRMGLLLAGGVAKENLLDLVYTTGVVHAHAGANVRIPPSRTGRVDETEVRLLRKAFDDGIEKLKK